MTITTILLIVNSTLLIGWIVAYRRLQRRHIETVGALWAATLERK